MGKGSSAWELSEGPTDVALGEGGAIDSWAGAELVGGGADEASDNSVQAVVRSGGRPSCASLRLAQEGSGMDGLTTGGADGDILDFFAQWLGGAGEFALNAFRHLDGVDGSSTKSPHDHWGQHSSYWSHRDSG